MRSSAFLRWPALLMTAIVIVTSIYIVSSAVIRPAVYSDSAWGFVGWDTRSRTTAFNHASGLDSSDIAREAKGPGRFPFHAAFSKSTVRQNGRDFRAISRSEKTGHGRPNHARFVTPDDEHAAISTGLTYGSVAATHLPRHSIDSGQMLKRWD